MPFHRSSSVSSDLSDRDLVQGVRRGSYPAGEMLVSRHWSRAWRAAYAVLGERAGADDAAQSAVERSLKSLDQFDDSRPFGPWLARIAVNQALNLLRARRAEVPLTDGHCAPDPYGEVLDRDEIFGAVGALSPDRRLVIVLRYWADMEPREIADALEIPVGTVTSRLSRALVDLRAALQEVQSS